MAKRCPKCNLKLLKTDKLCPGCWLDLRKAKAVFKKEVSRGVSVKKAKEKSIKKVKTPEQIKLNNSIIVGLIFAFTFILIFVFIYANYFEEAPIGGPTSVTKQKIEKAPIGGPTPVTKQKIEEKDIVEESLEYKLAVLNVGKYVEKDDLTINRFRYLLSTLEKKTKNTKQEIADMSVAALEKIAKEKYGLDITLLELMEGANDSIPEEAIGTDTINYAEIVVLYIELIK